MKNIRSIYYLLRSLMPNSAKGLLSKYLIYLRIRPSANHTVNSPFEKAVVTFSADFEMAWAFRYSKKTKDATAKGLHERENLPIILDLFNSHKIPVTWATVGHLFLSDCSSNSEGKPHPEMIRPSYFENKNWLFNSGDWYDSDPCSNIADNPAWYASDLIDLILNSETAHELGCHTFSHCDFTYKNCSPELALAEIQKCMDLARKKGVILKSMVFPGGTFGNYEILKNQGFSNYRYPTTYHIDLPYIDQFGLVAIPSSLGLDKDPYGWSKDFHLKMTRNYILKAIKYNLVCHFWFHPSMDSWYLENVLPELLSLVDEYRSKGKIDVLTMSQLAEEVLNGRR